MKSNIFKLYLLLVVIPLAVFSSCNSDEKEEFQATPNQTDLVGSWYFENSIGSSVNRIIYNYFSDGTYTFEAINMAGASDSKATTEKGSGIYHVSNGELRRGQNTKVGQGWLDPVTYTRQGSHLILGSKLDLSNQTFNLIVDSCRLQKGESTTFKYNGEYGRPYEYTTSSALVASVLENGLITANEYGVAYITGHCENNDVVIKIIVENGDKVTPDFMDDFWMPKDSVIAKYGDNGLSNVYGGEGERLTYVYGSDQINQLVFGFNKKERVSEITVFYWPSIDLSGIKEYFDKNYIYKEDSQNGRSYFKKMGDRVYRCTLDTLKRTASYSIEPINYDEFDEAIYYTIDEVLTKFLSHADVSIDYPGALTVQNLGNEIFKRMYIDFDPQTREILDIQLVANSSIAGQDLYNWALNNYPFIDTNGWMRFVNRTDTWNMKQPVYLIVITMNTGEAGLYYYK